MRYGGYEEDQDCRRAGVPYERGGKWAPNDVLTRRLCGNVDQDSQGEHYQKRVAEVGRTGQHVDFVGPSCIAIQYSD